MFEGECACSRAGRGAVAEDSLQQWLRATYATLYDDEIIKVAMNIGTVGISA